MFKNPHVASAETFIQEAESFAQNRVPRHKLRAPLGLTEKIEKRVQSRTGISSSLYYLLKSERNDEPNMARIREVGDLLVTTDLSKVFRVTPDGEQYAPEMKMIALGVIGPSLMGVR